MPNIAGITNYFPRAYENTVPMTLTSTILAGATTVAVTGMTNYTDGDIVAFVVDGATPALKQVFTGTKVGGNVTGVTWTEFPTGGVNVGHAAGATVIDYVTATHWDLFRAGILTGFNATGGLLTSAVQAALNITGGSAGGWTPLGFAPSGVVNNGNHSYTCTFAGQNLTNILSPGMRLQTNRTVSAPTQCTTLNGTNQFWNRSSTITGMTFTNNFTCMAYIKITSYNTSNPQIIMSRHNGTSGWVLYLETSGQLSLGGYNGGSGNSRRLTTYQSVPLNKWVKVSAELDMAGFTTATCKAQIDDVDAPVSLVQGGTNPTSLVQAGNLEVGSWNGGLLPFNGKIAQAAVFSALIAPATLAGYSPQGLAGTETSLISAFSFNGNANDLNANANSLTANNAAVATTADSPFGGQSTGAISATIDYGIVQSVVFSTNTTVVVQVPEGCTIPTSGGVASVFYSGVKVPYLFPAQRAKWQLKTVLNTGTALPNATGSWVTGVVAGEFTLGIPIGEWTVSYDVAIYSDIGASAAIEHFASLNTNTTTPDFTWTTNVKAPIGSGTSYLSSQHTRTNPLSLAAMTSYYAMALTQGGASNFQWSISAPSSIVAENAYL